MPGRARGSSRSRRPDGLRCWQECSIPRRYPPRSTRVLIEESSKAINTRPAEEARRAARREAGKGRECAPAKKSRTTPYSYPCLSEVVAVYRSPRGMKPIWLKLAPLFLLALQRLNNKKQFFEQHSPANPAIKPRCYLRYCPLPLPRATARGARVLPFDANKSAKNRRSKALAPKNKTPRNAVVSLVFFVLLFGKTCSIVVIYVRTRTSENI